ncbi:MAG TPA: hypothetical protein VGJ78_23780 [Vicinamibacterales bacterium]|jgi:hypothetical protein
MWPASIASAPKREVLDVEADRVIAAADRARAQGRLAGFFATAVDPASLVAADRVITVCDVPPIEVLVDQAEKTRGELLALARRYNHPRREAAGQRAAAARAVIRDRLMRRPPAAFFVCPGADNRLELRVILVDTTRHPDCALSPERWFT